MSQCVGDLTVQDLDIVSDIDLGIEGIEEGIEVFHGVVRIGCNY